MAGSDLLLQDALLVGTGWLSTAGASATTTATSLIDLGLGSYSQFDNRAEFVLTVPVLTSTQLPNSTTHTYGIYCSDSATTNAASAVALAIVPAAGDSAINSSVTAVQNFALGASSGSTAFTYTYRPRLSTRRYLWAQATCSASTAAASVSFTLAAVF